MIYVLDSIFSTVSPNWSQQLPLLGAESNFVNVQARPQSSKAHDLVIIANPE